MLSVDVEDWFHLIGAGLDYQFKNVPSGNELWDELPHRVVENTIWILDLLDIFQIKGTFFILGWVAERFPNLVLDIFKRGHEIGSHGYWHKVLSSQTPKQFRSDLRRSLFVLQDTIGEKILGYRTSSASITDWAIEIIGEEGLYYDSSLFPVSYHDVYGSINNTSRKKPIERLSNGLWEVKLSSLDLAGIQIPWSGGGYFRLMPYQIFRLGIRNIIKKKNIFHFYIHPWEIDANPPRLKSLKPLYSFRRYVSILKTRKRLQSLLSDFNFVPISQVLKEYELGSNR